MSPLANYASVLEIVFALNALTYFYSIEPKRRGEMLGLYQEFRTHIPDFSRRDREARRGYLILAHYGTVHFFVTFFSLVFSVTSLGLMLYSAMDSDLLVPARLMVPGMIIMLVLVPLGSVWLGIICRGQFKKYLMNLARTPGKN